MMRILIFQVTRMGDMLQTSPLIRSVIAFSLGELETQMREHPEYAARYDAAFTAAAAKLVAQFFTGKNDHGFFHWDAASTLVSPTPLFARAELMAGLKRLTPFRESTPRAHGHSSAFRIGSLAFPCSPFLRADAPYRPDRP